MSPYAILGLLLIAVLVLIAILDIFAFALRPAKPEYGRDDSLDDVEPTKRTHLGALAAPYGRPQKIFLTPRQLERVNIQRKLRNKAPLNQAGFANAAAHAWDQPRRQPDNSSDWLMYFVMYECLITDHQSHLVNASGGLTIDPNQPYNGQGGEFAGAGASGDWARSDPYAAVAATAYGASDVSETGSAYKPGDIVGGYGQTPAPQPPESAPSYTKDPDPDYSSSSSGSSSSDSSSSSSSSDSGGGGD